jgi:GMP synthase-like glutamine amidotransferase
MTHTKKQSQAQNFQTSNLDGWRQQSGYLSKSGSEAESIHILLGRFLADRDSQNPLVECSLLDDNQTFEWGKGQPLEKVIDSQAALEKLMLNPRLYRNAIAIIEPWEHVGHNPLGEPVRASVNVAYIAQKLADCDSIVFPFWSSGCFNLEQLIPVISAGVAIVVEGGDSSVRDPASFAGANCSHEEVVELVEEILLSRSQTSAAALLICLGHQLAAHAHVSLIKKAVAQVLKTNSLVADPNDRFLSGLKRVCRKIQATGESLTVRKGEGHIVAVGWNHPEFAVGPNETKEVGNRQLIPYQSPDLVSSDIPEDLILAHEVAADEHEGVIDTSIQYEHELNISMFHCDEVNEEAILFANWAYRLLHNALIPCRHIIANSPLSWLIKLPDAVEILCSTAEEGKVVTECSATCINYRDFETKEVRRSFTCQFHPELLSDLRAIGMRQPPSYQELKRDDGARLFARLLYAGMQE